MSRDDVSSVSGAFVDPLKLKPVRLGVGTVQHLVEKRYFAMHAGSPLLPVSKLNAPADKKNGKELLGIGVPAHPDPDARLGGKGRVYFDALKIIGAPEARLEYTELSGAGSMTVELVLGAGMAVIVDLDTDGLNLSPPLAYGELIKAMGRHLQNAALTFPNLNVWQSQMKTIGWVFTSLTQLPKALFEERVATASKLPAAEVANVTKDLLKAGLLTQHGEILSLNDQLRAFVERSAAGAVAELLVTPFDAKGNALERRELRFFGKPNDRVAVLTLQGEALKAAIGGEPPEPLLTTIMALSKDGLRVILEALLGVAAGR
jgi:hypothetical protein